MKRKLKQLSILNFFKKSKNIIEENSSDGNQNMPGTSASSFGKTQKKEYVYIHKEYLKLGSTVAPGSELNFFEESRNQRKTVMTGDGDKSLLQASYLVALRIAKAKKPFTIGEDLLKSYFLDIVQEILGPQTAEKLEAIPLSNMIIQKRIKDMANDIEKQVVEGIKNSRCFAIQLDESTDIDNCTILLCLVRYCEDEDLREELLCCLNLSGRTTSSEIFNVLDGYFKAKGLDWSKCVGVCTDGAANMAGHRSGVVAKIKEVAHPELVFTHCMIHRELSTELNTVMDDAVKIIYEIRSPPMNSNLFATLCDSMDSDHQHLLQHAEGKRLMRGRILASLFELREKVKQFLRERKSILLDLLLNEEWVAKLAYMADIFIHFDELNVSLQGAPANVFTLRNEMDAFKKKLGLWDSLVQKENIEMFPFLDEFWRAADVNQKVICDVISEHLRALAKNINNNFPENDDPRKGNLWINDPFLENIKSCALDTREKEKLIELSKDVTLVSWHKESSLPKFWLSLEKRYPSLSYKAIKLLVIFSSSYLCEKTISAMSLIKTKQGNPMDINVTFRLSETTLQPRI